MAISEETRLILRVIVRVLRMAASLFEKVLKGEPIE